MSSIAILGAGDLGAETARCLAFADLVTAIVLVDDQTAVAQGKALDIAQAAPVERYATAVSGSSDVSAVVGASAIVLADRAEKPPMEWRGDAGLALVKRVAGLNTRAPIVCAGVHQAALIEKGVGELGLARGRLFGSAAEALRLAIVALVALEAGRAPADVSLTVTGRVTGPIVVPWDDVSVAGRPLPQVVSTAQIARLEQRIARLWPLGSYALAASAARLIRTMLARSPYTHAATLAVTRDEGAPGRTAMLPVTLGPLGIVEVLRPTLAARDHVRLENALRS